MKVKVRVPIAINERGEYSSVAWGDPVSRKKDGMEEDEGDMQSQSVENLYGAYSEKGFDLCRVVWIEAEVEVPDAPTVQGKAVSSEEIEVE